MIATFVIEIALALYTVWRYKLNSLTRLVAVMLVSLAVFQLAEYMVCGGFGIDAMGWSRIGYVAITILPPLGLHIISVMSGKNNPLLVALAYTSAFVFMGYFLLAPTAFSGHTCSGNYVIFQIQPLLAPVYTLYYYGWVIGGMVASFMWANKLPKSKEKLATALKFFGVGYAAFLIPTTTVNIIDPATISGIPSIMCGFAVLFAVIVSWKVMPLVGVKK
jgi:hypothetical protein